MTTAIVTVFILGYAAIALEHSLKINKTAIALFLSVCCWTLYMSDCTSYVQALHGSAFSEFLNGLSHPGTLLESARRFAAEDLFLYHVGDACERASIMKEMAANVTNMAFDYLDAPVVVVGAKNWITPAYELDNFFFPQPSWIIDAIHEKIMPIPGYVAKANYTTQALLDNNKKGV